MMLDDDVRALNGYQLKRDFGDDARQAHAANGCPEQLRFAFRTATHAAAIGHNKLNLCDVVAESSVVMMILAVHVERDAAAKRDVLRARRDGWEPTSRHECFEHFTEGRARFGTEQTALFVEIEKAVQSLGQHHQAFR